LQPLAIPGGRLLHSQPGVSGVISRLFNIYDIETYSPMALTMFQCFENFFETLLQKQRSLINFHLNHHYLLQGQGPMA
jgi:hypothetical protein